MYPTLPQRVNPHFSGCILQHSISQLHSLIPQSMTADRTVSE
jgi:hypothetical protein